MELKEALKKIENDKTLKQKFYDDPKSELKSLGVNTANLKINKTSKEESKMLKASVCVSVGEIVGFSVG
ncbi:MAG: hypothetical protein ACERKD_00835 [Prolixibacteraceae bacterium]